MVGFHMMTQASKILPFFPLPSSATLYKVPLPPRHCDEQRDRTEIVM